MAYSVLEPWMMTINLVRAVHVSLFAVACAAMVSHTREARACSPPLDFEIPQEISPLPKDGFIPIRMSQRNGSGLRAEVTTADGSAIETVLESSSDPSTMFLRPAIGDFPPGSIRIALRYANEPTAYQPPFNLTVSDATSADWALHIEKPKVIAQLLPDESSPRVACHRKDGGFCGGPEQDETVKIASRVKKLPILSFEVATAPWARYLMQWNLEYSVRREDGSLIEQPATGFGTGNILPSAGVEYCVEMSATPRFGMKAPPRTARACAPNGDLRYDISQADHDEWLTRSSDVLDCRLLEFPVGGPVPGALREKSVISSSGCSTSPRGTRTDTPFLLLGLGAACLLARRRKYPRR